MNGSNYYIPESAQGLRPVQANNLMEVAYSIAHRASFTASSGDTKNYLQLLVHID